jgi:molybdopterin converting factor small subunit
MRIRFSLFARMKLDAGASALELEVPDGARLGEALELFYEKHPALREHRGSCLVAVGLDYAPLDRALTEGDEVLLIPPVQGG